MAADGAEDEALKETNDGRIQGYLYKVDGRSLVGPTRRKMWFVLPPEMPVLYCFKSSSDPSCSGRIPLGGAAFTFNPRETGRFEIHADNKIHLLEAANNKSRMEWLGQLQRSRKHHYDRGEEMVKGLSTQRGSSSHHSPQESSKATQLNPTSDASVVNPASPSSTFYLNADGGLHGQSFEIPATDKGVGRRTVDELLVGLVEETSNVEKNLMGNATNRLLAMTRRSIRSPSRPTSWPQPTQQSALEAQSTSRTGESTPTACEKCGPVIDHLRNRCYELSDELIAKEDLVNTLRKAVLLAHNQRDTLKRLASDSVARPCADDGESSTDTTGAAQDRLEAILEREERLVNVQFALSDARRENEDLKEENRRLESENSSLNAMIDAFRQSVQTKDELILKFCGHQAGITEEEVMGATDDGAAGRFPSIPSNELLPEAIAVDFGSTPTDRNARRLFEEASVNDVSEMKDLVDGYRTQNEFLNQEVLELQSIIRSLEERERRLIRQNYNLEALFYQVKSRYMMVLNHFRSSEHPKRALDPSLIEQLIEEAARSNSPARRGSPIGNLSIPTDPAGPSPFYGRGLPLPNAIPIDSDTDQLGFYIGSPGVARQRSTTAALGDIDTNLLDSSSAVGEPEDNAEKDSATKANPVSTSRFASATATAEEVKRGEEDDWMLRIAADFKQRADNIWTNVELENSKDYIDWLLKWDEFLVNYVQQPLLSMQNQRFKESLKALIRLGVPHAYRSRVWKSIIDHLTGNAQAETGKGYYECLVKKAEKVQESDSQSDAALKQIDLDLVRTLPNNKFFDTESSSKAQSLRRVLYAFRFHNRHVGYCQGLNRLAAIGLLYLQELDAFWFLVACVEHLQPVDYYTPTLAGAVVDQKILMDLVQERLPTLWSHLRHMNVDLSLFTLSWFLTVFVDTLPHSLYINIFDIFLYEGNKVLFRFALALLKFCELRLMQCSSLGGVNACLSALSTTTLDFKSLANVAFNHFNPFSSKWIESKRNLYTNQLRAK